MNDSIFYHYREIIPDFSDFQDSLHCAIPVHLRFNRLKIDPERLIRMLGEKDVHLKAMNDRDGLLFEAPGLNSPGKLLEYYNGYIHPQAFTSCLASIILAPEQGAYVLDMCASPGGKTAHLAQLMENRGLIVANELYPTRHLPLAHTISRLGVLNCVLTAYQAQEFPMRQRFDYILADVPCSGEGRIRIIRGEHGNRNYKGTVRPKILELQRKIIRRGYDLLEENGEMLYSTCTYNPDENESAVNFLLENRDAELLPIDTCFPHEQGLTQWRDERYDRRLERTARFYPHQVDSVGFFMARICRRR